jgi:hypothetical protein
MGRARTCRRLLVEHAESEARCADCAGRQSDNRAFLGARSLRRKLACLGALARTFAHQGVAVIGILSAQAGSERDSKEHGASRSELGITYPILLDSQNENWRRWKQPRRGTIYLIDKNGRLRHRWIGEPEHDNGEAKSCEWWRRCLRKK